MDELNPPAASGSEEIEITLAPSGKSASDDGETGIPPGPSDHPPFNKGGEEVAPENSPADAPEDPPEGGLSGARLEQLLAYCKLTELSDDPEVAALVPVLYSAAVGYMDNAGVSLPEEGTPRRALYDLCVNHLVLDAYERRETATAVSDNPAFRRLMHQLKITEPEVEL